MNRKIYKYLLCYQLCFFACLYSINSFASNFPNRPVTVVVPFPPGGATDITARLIMARLSEKWGQSIIIENKPGADGLIGTSYVSRARPDGYTLLAGNIGSLVISPLLKGDAPEKMTNTFAPVAMFVELPFVVVVNPKLPINSVKELIAYANKFPNKATYASSGIGSGPHLATELFAKDAGVKLIHVPYKGGGPAIQAVMSGEVDMYFATALESLGALKGGYLRGLAVSTSTKSEALPNLPTISSLGFAGFNVSSWNGLVVPIGTPDDVKNKLSSDLTSVMMEQVVQNELLEKGAIPMPLSSVNFKERMKKDGRQYQKIIRELGLQSE